MCVRGGGDGHTLQVHTQVSKNANFGIVPFCFSPKLFLSMEIKEKQNV